MLDRVWAVVTELAPLEVLMFDGGLVIFGAAATGGQQPRQELRTADLIVNLWQTHRSEATVWR